MEEEQRLAALALFQRMADASGLKSPLTDKGKSLPKEAISLAAPGEKSSDEAADNAMMGEFQTMMDSIRGLVPGSGRTEDIVAAADRFSAAMRAQHGGGSDEKGDAKGDTAAGPGSESGGNGGGDSGGDGGFASGPPAPRDPTSGGGGDGAQVSY
jgi:hypothetical protein